MEKKTIMTILSLVQDLPRVLENYFSTEQFIVLKRNELDNETRVHYIIVSDFESAVIASNEFSTVENEIEIICLSEFQQEIDLKVFLSIGGRLFSSPALFETTQGKEILDNYFLKKASTHLLDLFESLSSETERFSITNYLNSGAHFDKVCFEAESNGFSSLPMRTFLDHGLFYLTYLKQKARGSIPFEFEYTNDDRIFVMNMCMSVKDFFAEDLMESFGDFDHRNPYNYLLKTLSQTCDYLDICYLQNPSKVILKAFWNKDRAEKSRGLCFHQIRRAEKVSREVSTQTSSFDLEEEIFVGSGLPEGKIDIDLDLVETDQIEVIKERFSHDEEFQLEISNVAAEAVAEEVVKEVEASKLSLFLEKTLVKGKKEALDDEVITIGGDVGSIEEDVIRIKGSKNASDNFKTVVKGLEKENSFVQVFSRAVTKKEKPFIIPGEDSSKGIDKFVIKTLESAKELEKLGVEARGFLRSTAPAEIKKGLESFARERGISVEKLTAQDIKEFQTKNIPLIISNLSNDKNLIEEFTVKISGAQTSAETSAFDFDRMSLKDPNTSDFSGALQDNIVMEVRKLGEELPENEMQLVLRKTVKEQVATIIDAKNLTNDEKEQHKKELVNDIAKTLGIDAKDVERLVHSTSDASTEKVKHLVQEKMSRGNGAKDIELEETISLEDKNNLLRKLSGGEALSEREAKQIEKVFEQEEKVKKQTKEAEKNIRKLSIQAEQKEVVFSQEMERFEKTIKEKDLVVEKSKQSMRSAVAKKEAEMCLLKEQVSNLSQQLKNDESAQLRAELKLVSSEKESLARSSEIYKKKLESLAKQTTVNTDTESPEFLADENKALKRAKASLEKQTKTMMADSKKMEARFQKTASNEIQLKVENQRLQGELKAALGQARSLKEKSRAIMENAKKQATGQAGQLQKDLDLQKKTNTRLTDLLKKSEGKLKEAESLRGENEQLRAKLQTMVSKMKSSTDLKSESTSEKGNVSQAQQRLERSVKKLNADLVKVNTEAGTFKKDALKAKKEITGLKNQLAIAKRDLEKAKKQIEIADKKSKAA